MVEVRRSWLRDLLRGWQSGRLTGREVHEEAERVWEGFDQWPDYGRADPRSIDLAVLDMLACLIAEQLLPVDIPALLAFLATPGGHELEGWKEFDGYLATIDFEGRRRRNDLVQFYDRHVVNGWASAASQTS